jgi:hypothetical protein
VLDQGGRQQLHEQRTATVPTTRIRPPVSVSGRKLDLVSDLGVSGHR